jgi:CRISPR/Cas system-associated endonuclease Cas1
MSVAIPVLHRGVLYLDNPGVLMSVHGRVLVLKINHQFHSLPRSVRTIVAGGRGFAITGAAIKACIAENIELLISDYASAFVSLFATEPRCDASRASLAVRCRQFETVIDPAKTAKIARAIVAMKVKAEGHAGPVQTGVPNRAQSGTDNG